MSSYHYCERCGEAVYPGSGVVAWTLDNREVVIHADRAVCEYNIRTDPDVVPVPGLRLVDAGIREPEPRTTGLFERDSGSPHYLRGA